MKKNSTWGRRPYTKVDPDEPIDVPIYKPVKIQERKESSEKAKKSSEKQWEQKKKVMERLNRHKEKRSKSRDMKRGVFILRGYMSFLHRRNQERGGRPMEVHHWMPRSRIRQNDYFVCCISPEEHHKIHHGGGSVNGYIEKVGIENLLADSAIMFAEWLATSEAKADRYYKHYVAMIKDIRENPTDFDYVLERTRECAEDIRLEKLNR